MTIVRVKGFKIFPDRHRKMRCYHRRTKTPIDLKKAPIGSPAFFAECARITELAKVVAPAKSGTLGSLFEQYKAHPAFTDLAPNTRRGYQSVFDYLRPIADTPLNRFDPPLVVGIRDEAAKRGRRSANLVKAVLSLTFAWGVERGLLASNPAKGVKNIRRARGTPDANRPWTDAERHAALDHAPAHMRPALALMMFTGLGPGTASSCRAPSTRMALSHRARQDRRAGVLAGAEAATRHSGGRAQARRHYALRQLGREAVDRKWVPCVLAHLPREAAKGRTAIGPGLTLYGLRHTVAVILRECGFDERTIADALGQRTIEMARHYAKGADLTIKMRDVAKKFEREVNRRRTKVSNLPGKVSNLGAKTEGSEMKFLGISGDYLVGAQGLDLGPAD